MKSEYALFAYKCSDIYLPQHEVGVAWNDPALAISWPVSQPTISEKDQRFPSLAQIDPARLPPWKG